MSYSLLDLIVGLTSTTTQLKQTIVIDSVIKAWLAHGGRNDSTGRPQKTYKQRNVLLGDLYRKP